MSSNLQEIIVVGNLVDEPELKFTPSGVAVANFTVAKNPRRFNSSTNEWEDQETLYFRVSAWKNLAENFAASDLSKGTRVMVTGIMSARTYEKDGENRTVWEVTADEIAVSLKFAEVGELNKNVYKDDAEPEQKKPVAKPSPKAAPRRQR